MSTKIIYLSTFLPRDKKDFYASKMHNFNFNSADAFSYSVFCGLAVNLGTELQIINIPPLGAYPRYNSLIYSSSHKCTDNGVKVNSIANSNLYVYQYFSIYKNTLRELKQLDVKENHTLLIYSINIPVVKAAINYRKKYAPKTKIVLIIPDLLEDCMEKSLASKIKMSIIGSMDDIYKEMDGFVFLTEQMNEKVKTKQPYCIMEGIYNSNERRIPFINKESAEKKVFYSGMLYEKFGVKALVDAFCMTTNVDYRLQICGCGELEEYIKQKQAKDNRIQFLGLVSREEALKYQSSASLLVNPRTPEGDFTKYSFPSKDIEYLVSGTPTLIYQLPGIPSEYYEYCYSLGPEQVGVEFLTSKINEILSLSNEERDSMGRAAHKFIVENKNSKAQTKKIIKLINDIQ